MNPINRLVCCIVFVYTASLWQLPAQATYSYTFDNLNTGALSVSTVSTATGNQDGWYLDNALPTAVAQIIEGSGTPAPGRIFSSPVAGYGFAQRIFGDFFSGTETSAVLQVDFQLIKTAGAFQVALAGNGGTSSFNSNSQNRYSPKFCVIGGNNKAVFRVYPKTTSGLYGTPLTQTISGLIDGHWYSVRLLMDFTAYSGNGSCSLTYRDLTAGKYEYIYPGSLQNINMGVTNNANGYGPNGWNQVWIRTDGETTTTSLPINNLYISPLTTQATYYVSPTGSDANNGLTPATPFQTLVRARDAVRTCLAGVVAGNIEIVLRGGIYPMASPLQLTDADSGKNGYSVLWRAYPNEIPVLSGAKTLTGWTLHDSNKNIWCATAIPELETRQIYINGLRAVRARSNIGLNNMTSDSSGHTTTDFALSTYANPSDMEMVYHRTRSYGLSRCGIASITRSGTLAGITMKQPGWSYCNSLQGFPSCYENPYYENAYELLDTPGEWYLDRTGAIGGTAGIVYYIPKSGENMSTANVQTACTESLLTVTGSSLNTPAQSIQFHGIRFQHATWLTPSGNNGHADLQAGVKLEANRFVLSGAAISLATAKKIVFERCDFMNLGGSGINLLLGTQDVTVQGCRFIDISGAGIQVGSPDSSNTNTYNPSDERYLVKNIAIANNRFDSIGVEYESAVAILGFWPQGLKVDHNYIHDVGYTGISLGWGWYMPNVTACKLNAITNNHITDVTQTLDDGAAIYTLTNYASTTESSTISGNFIENISGLNPLNNPAIYFDMGSNGYSVSNNVCNTPSSSRANRWNQLYIRVDGTTATPSTPLNNLRAGNNTYTLDNLAVGPLTTSTICGAVGNQDGWYTDNCTPTSIIQVYNGTGTPSAGIVIASNPGATNSSGRALRLCGSPFFTGTENAATLQFDLQSTVTAGGVHMAVGGNGYDVPLTSINAQPFSPIFGVNKGGNWMQFWLKSKDVNGAFSTTSYCQTISNIPSGHWYQVKLTMDFTANNGNGSGSLAYRNLTLGDTSFIPLGLIQNINLRLLYNAPRVVQICAPVCMYNITANNSYSNSPNNLNLGTNCTVDDPILFYGQNYPIPAQSIIGNAGPISAFADVLLDPTP